MNGKFLLGFVIGVVGASAVAYREMQPPLPVVPDIASPPIASRASTATQKTTQNAPDTSEPSEATDPAPTPDPASATPSDDTAQASPPQAPSETHPQIDVGEAQPSADAKPERRPKPIPRYLPHYSGDARRVPLPHYESLPVPQPVEQKSIQPEKDPLKQAVPDSDRNDPKSDAPLTQALPPPDAPAQSAPASEWHTLSGPRHLPTGAANPGPSTRTPGANLIPRESPSLSPRPGVSGPLSGQPSGPIASLRPPVASLPDVAPEISARPEWSAPVRTPNTVTLTAGTPLSIRLGEKLSSDHNHAGDNFFAALDQPLVTGGFVIAERGERVEGRIADTRAPGRHGTPELCVELTSVRASDGQVVTIHTAPYVRQESKRSSSAAGKVGGGAAIGAAIGAIAGAGVGAAIGAGVGGAAGVGTALVTHRKPVVIPVETLLTFRLDQPVTITEQLR